MVTHTLSPLRALTALTLTGALVALFNVGCVVPTVVGGDDGSLTGASGDPQAIAYHQAPDPTTLHVLISTFSPKCADPNLGSGDTGGTCPVGWSVDFALPSASQVPGVYALSDPAFQSMVIQELGSDGNGGCMGGGGGGFDAKVEVVSIDATTIKVRLSGFDSDGDLPHADGDYDVQRCM
jgi:hypothetical protein